MECSQTPGGFKGIQVQEESSAPTCRWCSSRILRLPVVRYLVSPTVWTDGLRQTAHRAWSSVANADAPLADELATAFAFGGHSVSLFRLVKGELPDNTHAQEVPALRRPGLISASTTEQ
jgi:hypothetical protein